jgi:hypothetical protein
MSVQVIQMFTPTVLTTSAATLYTVSTGSAASVLARGRIRFTNTTAVAATVTAYGVPSAGTAGSGNNFCPTLSVPAYSNLDVDVPVIGEGGFIQALASAGTTVTAHAMDGVLFS